MTKMDEEISVAKSAVETAGFHIWKGFQTGAFCKAFRTRAEALLESDAASRYPRSTRVWELYRHGDDFVELMCDRRLVKLVEALLGRFALVSDFSLNQVAADALHDQWHIDYPYNEMSNLVTGSMLGLQCIMPLSPFSEATGATQFVPGSHTRYSWPTGDPSAEAATFVAEPGDLLVMAASTWHRAGVNTTPDSRTAVLFSFVEAWVRPMTGPPEDGPWGATQAARLLLAMERPPEEMPLDGVPV